MVFLSSCCLLFSQHCCLFTFIQICIVQLWCCCKWGPGLVRAAKMMAGRLASVPTLEHRTLHFRRRPGGVGLASLFSCCCSLLEGLPRARSDWRGVWARVLGHAHAEGHQAPGASLLPGRVRLTVRGEGSEQGCQGSTTSWLGIMG